MYGAVDRAVPPALGSRGPRTSQLGDRSVTQALFVVQTDRVRLQATFNLSLQAGKLNVSVLDGRRDAESVAGARLCAHLELVACSNSARRLHAGGLLSIQSHCIDDA